MESSFPSPRSGSGEPGQKAGVLEYLLNGEKIIGEMDVVTAEAAAGGAVWRLSEMDDKNMEA